VNARHKQQQQSHIDSLHSNITTDATGTATGQDDDDDANTSRDRLSRMVRFTFHYISVNVKLRNLTMLTIQ